MEAPSMAATADPEAAFLASKQQTGNEWELFKENVRPLKRGRDVSLLNKALRSDTDASLKKSLLETRRRYIKVIEDYDGDDPLQPWLDCIKWVQESFPAGGECSGLVVIYEQCVRTFWHECRYKEDLRYLKVWLEYAENCADAEVIYNFLEANEIGQGHSIYYSSYAHHMESNNKMRRADEIFQLGKARSAKPLEKLEGAYKGFLARLTKRKRDSEDNSEDNQLPVRSFGTNLTTTGANRQPAVIPDPVKRRMILQRIDPNIPLSIYNDTNAGANRRPVIHKNEERSWPSLGTRTDRNKENTSIPAKWVSHKVPQNAHAAVRPSASIEIFVDEDSAQVPSIEVAKDPKPSVLQLRKANNKHLKKETELLKENPLRNFHLTGLR